MKRFKRILTNNFIWYALLLLVQILYLVYFLIEFSVEMPALNIILRAISLFAVLHILNRPVNPAYKIAWIILILVFPLFGMITYIFLRRRPFSRRNRLRMMNTIEASKQISTQNNQLLESIDAPMTKKQANRLFSAAHAPVCSAENIVYFSSGESFFEKVIEKLSGAKRFIFMEFFIISSGELWNRISSILKQKAANGVDVRIIYDDIGSQRLPKNFVKEIRQNGIQVFRFNPFRPFFNLQMNNRTHRKMLIIDGEVAFTGGMNIADEYVNIIERFGHWKDAGVMFDGIGINTLTQAFLELWSMYKPLGDYFTYLCAQKKEDNKENVIIPFVDYPSDTENVTHDMYLQMIYCAKKYIWFFTPYLIIDNELRTALISAKKSGIDVRIVVPHIPDKKTVFELTKAYYSELVENGIKVYEYTKGFVHSKVCFADDRYAYVGTCNLDYRSLFLHLECGVYIDSPAVCADIKQDFEETFSQSYEVNQKDLKTGKLRALWRSILYAFAPLM